MRSDCEKEIAMANLVLKNRQDVEDFVRGCAFYATGGGGLPANGIASLMSEIDAGRDVAMTDYADLADDAVTACPFLMGSIAPHTPEVLAEMAGFGFNKTVNTEKDRMRKAIEELENYMGSRLMPSCPSNWLAPTLLLRWPPPPRWARSF